MGTWCLRHTLIVLFSFRFLPSHIHLSKVTDLICIADTVMKTDFEFIEQFQKEICSAFISSPIWTIRNCTHSVAFDKRTRLYVCFFLRWYLFVYTKSVFHHCCLEVCCVYNFHNVEMDGFFYCKPDGNRSKRWETARLSGGNLFN